jgi:DNA-binding response OmpR family regulator
MGYKILVVEDDADARKIISLVLKLDGFIAMTAPSGPDALEYLENDLPDLVLLDVIMPDMDGYEVCQRIRSNLMTAHVPVVMLSGRNDEASIARGYAAGADDYLPKPIKPSSLTKKLRALIMSHSRQLVA